MSVPKLTNELFKTEPFSFFMQAHKFQAPHVESALRVDVLTVAVSLLFFFQFSNDTNLNVSFQRYTHVFRGRRPLTRGQ